MILLKPPLLTKQGCFYEMLQQYPPRYQALLGKRLLGNHQSNAVVNLIDTGSLYAGSNRLAKDGMEATCIDSPIVSPSDRFGEGQDSLRGKGGNVIPYSGACWCNWFFIGGICDTGVHVME